MGKIAENERKFLVQQQQKLQKSSRSASGTTSKMARKREKVDDPVSEETIEGTQTDSQVREEVKIAKVEVLRGLQKLEKNKKYLTTKKKKKKPPKKKKKKKKKKKS